MEFLNIVNETEKEFEEIAQKLFDNYAIKTSSGLYRFVEIEFYWNSATHIDNSTYKRNHVDPNVGEWFFHYSGVDITLRNEKGYGGILIRSVYDIEKDKIVKGPMVCSMILFSGTNAFKSCIQTQIVEHDFPVSSINKGQRIGLGKNAKSTGADKFNCAFEINPRK